MTSLNADHGPIEYEVEGADGTEPLVLISGLGGQLVRWSPFLREALVSRGFRVIRLDNRDVGLSANYEFAGIPDLNAVTEAVSRGESPDLPYTLTDMAGDITTLLDALHIQRAHIVGRAMGGYIAQLFAARHPDRIRSLTLIMSSTGNPNLPGPTRKAQAMLKRRALLAPDLDASLAHALASAQVYAGPLNKLDPQRLREIVLLERERGVSPGGYARQWAAIIADGDRRERIRHISAPTMILHGEADPLVRVQGAYDLAATIAGSELRTFADVGHEIPNELIPDFTEAIYAAAQAFMR